MSPTLPSVDTQQVDFATMLKDGWHWVYIECRQHKNSIWCPDRTSFMQKERDLKVFPRFWNRNEQKFGQGVLMAFPITPNNGLFVKVRIQTFENQYLEWATADSNGEPKWVLGYFTAGESLAMIRGILIQRFSAHLPDTLRCKSASHSMQAETSFKRRMNDPSLKITELISIYENGMCLTCFDKSVAALSSFDPDLLPGA